MMENQRQKEPRDLVVSDSQKMSSTGSGLQLGKL